MRFLTAVAFLCTLLFASSALAADASGNWIGKAVVQGEQEDHPLYLVLKQDGADLTGTGGPSAEEQIAIEPGKVDGAKVTFVVKTPKMTLNFEFTLDGDTLKGVVNVEHDGQKAVANVDLKRAA